MKTLLTITAIVAGAYLSAQCQYPEFYRGDTTFYFLTDYFDQFEFMEGTESMDIGHIGEQVYTFSLQRATKTVYAVPVSRLPRCSHDLPTVITHKHEAYTKTASKQKQRQTKRDFRKRNTKNNAS